MQPHNGTASADGTARALEEYLAAVEAGTAPPREEFLDCHPELAEDLDACLAALRFIGRAAQGPLSVGGADVLPLAGPDGGPVSGVLGDFRIVRELGRGGMGVVYEAEQISLGRRVALKVLPFAATMDPRQLQRFHNEARAAASLDHPHIVPVHAVGCERAVHFYAMQLIEGQTLAAIIAQMRRAGGQPVPIAEQLTTPHVHGQPAPPSAETTPRAAGSTKGGPRDRAHYRWVAELGIQAAEALDHAHHLGIVHRDIKPANLLVDGRGGLWVTDFGLAHIHTDARLTITGDLVGTLRYMSPEQALAKRVVIDHRTDVYSLGATLYEVLALEPAFGGADRQELLRQIAFEEPRPPRRINKTIPAELETVVLKALEKNPADRYATAKELADDLRHWLEDRPIRARRQSLLQRGRKWGRRHKAAVRAAAVAAAAVLLVLGWALGDAFQRYGQTEQAVSLALEEAQHRQEEGKVPEALSAAQRAEGLAQGGTAGAGLRRRVHQRVADLQLVADLEEVRLEMTAIKDGYFDWGAADARYGQTFLNAGLDVEGLSVEEAGERIRATTVAVELAAFLDHWASIRRVLREADDPSANKLLAVARCADRDPWRTRMREALERRDRQALRELAASEDVSHLSAATLAVLGSALLEDKEALAQKETFLREAQRRHPNDFWLNFNLYVFYETVQPPQWEEAFHFAAVAVALRPQSPGAHVNLGNALSNKGRLDEAIAEYHEAIRLKKDDPLAHNNLGEALRKKGQLDEAIAECREAIRLKKDFAEAHNNLGLALSDKGQLKEAIAEYHEAIRLKKDYPLAHNNLGTALREKGQLEEAITEYHEAIRLKKDFAEAHNNLGLALSDKGQLEEAIAEYHEAIRLRKDFAEAHTNLGIALDKKGQLEEAMAEYREAIRLKKDFAGAHYNLGNALSDKGQLDEAIAEYHEAIRLKKDFAKAHNSLGNTLREKGRLEEAIAECREAIRLKKDDPLAHNNLGAALSDKGQLEEAMAEYREAIRLKKDFAEAHYNLGIALAGKGQLEEAITEYREAIRLKKDYPVAHIGLGDALYKKGQLDEAIAEIREAIRLKKDYAEAHYNLGVVLSGKGQIDEAIAEYHKAIYINKDHAESHCNLGLALLRQGQFAQALAYLRRGHQLGSSRPGWPYPSAQWLRKAEQLAQLMNVSRLSWRVRASRRMPPSASASPSSAFNSASGTRLPRAGTARRSPPSRRSPMT